MERENLLRNIYIGLLVLLFGMVVSTPLFISHGVSVFSEEMIEAGILLFLIIISFAIYSLYRKELSKREEELNETQSYIGSVNLEVEQIKSIFDAITKYPESKKDFKFIFEALAQRALAGVNSDWVLFRIIDIQSGKTLTEYTRTRGAAVLLKSEVSNKELMEGKNPESCRAVGSEQENLNIKVFCIMPVRQLNKNQEVLLKAIVSNLGMLYLVFESAADRRRTGNH